LEVLGAPLHDLFRSKASNVENNKSVIEVTHEANSGPRGVDGYRVVLSIRGSLPSEYPRSKVSDWPARCHRQKRLREKEIKRRGVEGSVQFWRSFLAKGVEYVIEEKQRAQEPDKGNKTEQEDNTRQVLILESISRHV